MKPPAPREVHSRTETIDLGIVMLIYTTNVYDKHRFVTAGQRGGTEETRTLKDGGGRGLAGPSTPPRSALKTSPSETQYQSSHLFSDEVEQAEE